MSAAERINYISVEDYLSGEPLSEVRHEYVDGQVMAMAGASRNHNRSAINVVSALQRHLKDSPCEPFMSDMKVRLTAQRKEMFYYPDIVVSCDPRDTEDHFLSFPKLIIEVLSKSTQRLDTIEKFQNYITIPTLEEYVLISQERVSVSVLRRRSGWAEHVYSDLAASLELESVGLLLPLSDLYQGVSFPADDQSK